MFDNKERKQYKYWSFLMRVLPRIISEWTMKVICKLTAGSTTSISRFLKTILRKWEKMYSVTEKTIWNMKQALLKQKPQLSLTLWNIKNSFLCTRAKAETSAKHRQLFFQPRDAAAELLFARNTSLRIILKGDRIWWNNRSFRSDWKMVNVSRYSASFGLQNGKLWQRK